jgi:hypothetical protein
MGVHCDDYDRDGRDPRGRNYAGVDRRRFRWDRYGKFIGHVVTRTDRDP